jgi:hypothetical protein
MKRTSSLQTTTTKFLCVAFALTAFACGGDDDSEATARVYTGDVPGTEVRVGIIASDKKARIFFCGGPTTYETMTGWLTADVDSAHKLSLPPPQSHDWILQGQVGDAEINGTIDMGNATPLAFRATSVSVRTISGLYEGSAGCGRLGLIVVQATPDSPAIGQGACVGQGRLEQVNPLEPIVRGADGAIKVKVASSTKEQEVRAASPPLDQPAAR